jgi:hypothetical protein
MRIPVAMLLLFTWACDATPAPSPADAALPPPDADLSRPSCPPGTDGLGTWIVFADGRCRSCSIGDDAFCAALHPPLGDGCRIYCSDRDLCAEKCPDTCPPAPVSDAGPAADAGPGCTPGAGSCSTRARPVCDPTCGTNGECRPCVFHDECEADYGAGAACARHCGTCCGLDGGPGCGCI